MRQLGIARRVLRVFDELGRGVGLPAAALGGCRALIAPPFSQRYFFVTGPSGGKLLSNIA